MKNLELMGVQEMDAKEMRNVDGGGWLADAITWLICDCNWKYPASSYHNAMMVKGI